MKCILYNYVFCIGTNHHRVVLFDNWTPRDGAHGKSKLLGTDPNFAKLYSEIYEEVPKGARKSLKDVARQKIQMIILSPEGRTLERG